MQIGHYNSLPLVAVMNKMSQSRAAAYYSILISTVAVPYRRRYKESQLFKFDDNKVRLLCLP